MTMKLHAFFALALFAFAAPLAAQNASAPSVESRLREQIKSVTGQLRTAETEKATLQTEKAALEEKVKVSATAVVKLDKDLTTETERAKKEGETLRTKITEKEAELAQKQAELAKSTDFGTKAADLARNTEAARSKLDAENILLKRIVADQRTKNGKMFEIGNEILTRYQKFGFGTAITSREPFVGITRAKLETLVEEYGGKIAEQRIKAVGETPVAKSSQEASKKPKAAPSDTRRPKD